MSKPGEAEFMMPVPAEQATAQFFIEAMKANTEAMKQNNLFFKNISNGVNELTREQREQRATLDAVKAAVIRIEAAPVATEVAELKIEVKGIEERLQNLERVEAANNGGKKALWTLVEKAPSILGIVLAFVAMAYVYIRTRVGGQQ